MCCKLRNILIHLGQMMTLALHCRSSNKYTQKLIWRQGRCQKQPLEVRTANLLKKRLQHKCFPVNFAKFLRKRFLQNIFGRMLLIRGMQQKSKKKNPNNNGVFILYLGGFDNLKNCSMLILRRCRVVCFMFIVSNCHRVKRKEI